MKKVLIIGAGFGGLAAASLLALEGYQVSVLEKNDQPGGRAQVWEKNGFTFNLGPTRYFMPDVFESFFSQFNKKPTDFYQLKKLDPNFQVFFARNNSFEIPNNFNEISSLFHQLEPNGRVVLNNFLSDLEGKYNLVMKKFIYRKYDRLNDFFDQNFLLEGLKLKLFQSMNSYVKSYFKNEKVQKILLSSNLFLGANLERTPSIYSFLPYLDFKHGVWYPVGGLNSVALGFYKLACELGVKFYFNTPVKKIEPINQELIKVSTESLVLNSNICIVNADYAHCQLELLSEEYQTYDKNYWQKRAMAPSALILCLGINKKLPKLTHHNLFFDSDWDSHLNSIFNSPMWPYFPSFYLNCPSKTDSTVAPPNNENLTILMPIAADLKDTDSIRKKYVDLIIKRIEKQIGEGISNSIVVKKVFAVNDFKTKFNAYKGTAFGLAPNYFQTAFFRPNFQSQRLKNLFFVGQYTHPGASVPMSVVSAKILSRIIEK